MEYNTIYRISKYDPIFRINGAYTRDEWTDYGCIGHTFLGERLTRKEYNRVESQYLATLNDVLEYLSITEMAKGEMEWPNTFYRIFKRSPRTYRRDGILKFAKGCLRNRYWAQMLHPNLRIHFAWDFYMELGCDAAVMPKEEMYRIVQKNQLHCQVYRYDEARQMYFETESI